MRPLRLVCALALLAACHRAPRGKLVVGVDAQPGVVSQIGKVHVVAKVGDKIAVERDVVPEPAPSSDPFAAPKSPFPFEIPLEGAVGDEIDVTLTGYRAGPNNTVTDKVMIARRTVAPLIAGDKPSLVELQLESACMTGVPGFRGPACPAAQSCAKGRCIDPTLLAEDLEPYVPTWATIRPDACSTPDGGAPIVALGTGASDYEALREGETLSPEKGPQGGHHLWIAVRMKNLRQAAATVILTAEQPGTGLKVPPTTFVFSFDPDSGGYCKLFGLRFQLDNASVPVGKFLAAPLDVKVTVRDTLGRTGEAAARVQVAATTIGD